MFPHEIYAALVFLLCFSAWIFYRYRKLEALMSELNEQVKVLTALAPRVVEVVTNMREEIKALMDATTGTMSQVQQEELAERLRVAVEMLQGAVPASAPASPSISPSETVESPAEPVAAEPVANDDGIVGLYSTDAAPDATAPDAPAPDVTSPDESRPAPAIF